MMNVEKVIKELECCTKKMCIYKDTEKECPYWELCGSYEDAFEDCTTALSKDALALLKAQEPVAVIPAVKKDGELLHEGNCPVCGMKLDWFYNGNYCGCCGQAVKWE